VPIERWRLPWNRAQPFDWPGLDLRCVWGMWENIAAAGWAPEEIAGALYELTANHLIPLRENDALDCGLQAPRSGADTVS
jgi:hypothetical protein